MAPNKFRDVFVQKMVYFKKKFQHFFFLRALLSMAPVYKDKTDSM